MKIRAIALFLFLFSTVPYFLLVPTRPAAVIGAAVTYLCVGFFLNLITQFEEKVALVFLLWFPAMMCDKPEWMSN